MACLITGRQDFNNWLKISILSLLMESCVVLYRFEFRWSYYDNNSPFQGWWIIYIRCRSPYSPGEKLADKTFVTFQLNVTKVIKVIQSIYLVVEETPFQSRTMNLRISNITHCYQTKNCLSDCLNYQTLMVNLRFVH